MLCLNNQRIDSLQKVRIYYKMCQMGTVFIPGRVRADKWIGLNDRQRDGSWVWLDQSTIVSLQVLTASPPNLYHKVKLLRKVLHGSSGQHELYLIPLHI